MRIREIEEGDNEQLAQLIRSIFEEHKAPKKGTVYSDPNTDRLYEIFQHPKSIFWVIEEDGKILGSCGIYPTKGLPEGYVELVKLYFLPSIRGKGLGSQLINKSIDFAKKLGYTTLYIESLPEFKKAVSMYERLGFKRLDHPLGESGHTTCDIWMVKDLD